MTEEKLHSITETVKALEVQANEQKIELRGTISKLQYAYVYETELLERLATARKNTKELQKQVHNISVDIQNTFSEMGKEVELFTGNFFNNHRI